MLSEHDLPGRIILICTLLYQRVSYVIVLHANLVTPLSEIREGDVGKNLICNNTNPFAARGLKTSTYYKKIAEIYRSILPVAHDDFQRFSVKLFRTYSV